VGLVTFVGVRLGPVEASGSARVVG
jgi:hypothetical protein